MYLGKNFNEGTTKRPYFYATQTYIATSSVLNTNKIVNTYNSIYYSAGLFNNGRYTIPISGHYYFIFCITDNNNSLGDFWMLYNGGGGPGYAAMSAVGTTRHSSNEWASTFVDATKYMRANDYIEVNHTSHGNHSYYCRYSFGGFLLRTN